MVLQAGAARVADSSRVPTAVRSVLGYYADTGVFDYSSLSLKSEIDDRTEAMMDDVYDRIEDALAEEFGHSVDFSYDTKLILPAQLTLGYVYRAARTQAETDPVGEEIATGVPPVEDAVLDGETPTLTPREQVVRAEQMTRLSIEALVDGDMRDAINDAEFEDFEVDFDADEDDRRRVAEVAQTTLQSHLEGLLDDLPDSVGEAYQWAVDYSEAHQDRDDYFRGLMDDAEAGDEAAMAAIREEYKFADYDEPPAALSAAEQELPYSKTQYARVGVIYDGMLDLYRLAGLNIDDDFAKAIVLAIIGAQIWLDDVDDYDDDRAEGQLTPVTAEYLLAPDDRAAYSHVFDITEQYLDIAKRYATKADSPLTGVAVEYIFRSGEPDILPGHH
jgi:hypothetical protein